MNLWRFGIPQPCLPDKVRGLFSRMLLSRFLAISLLLGCMALPMSGFAATLQGIKFQDLDNNGAWSTGDIPYPNHRVMIRNRDNGQTLTARTDANGYYQINNIPLTGDYIIITAFPEEKCLTTLVTAVTFPDVNTTRQINFGYGDCDEPIKDACNENDATHISAGDGDWDFPGTWGAGSVPGDGALVLIKTEHKVRAPNSEIFLGGGGLCINGTLYTDNGIFTTCNIPVNQNHESIHAQNIVIFARQVENTSTGEIRAGNGGDSPPVLDPNDPTDEIDRGGCSQDKYWPVRNQCGEAVNSIGGHGGSIEIYSTTTITQGNIVAGHGGHAAASHAQATAGNGGLIQIITAMDDDIDSFVDKAISTGFGGDTCANARWGVTQGTHGKIILNLEEIGGKLCEGDEQEQEQECKGIHLHWDPMKLKARKGLKLSNYGMIDISTDAGGTIDLTELEDGAISAEIIRIQTKALNGAGGTIDLRGTSGKIFTATQKIEIYADGILTDESVSIYDLIDAPEIIIESGRIGYFVSITSDALTIGEPNETIEISVRVTNTGPQVDTYSFTTTSANGWNLGTLADITLESMEVKTIKFTVVLPAQRGVIDDIELTVTSQAEPSVTETLDLQVMVEAGDDSDGDNYPDSLDAFPDDPTEWKDSDGDGIGDNADPDRDNDGMPNTFEELYFETLVSVIDDANEDADKDGFSNFAEFEANTDPTDANSKPVQPYVDVWLADPPPDDGSEPGKASRIWTSPDIWVRNQDDDGTSYQNVIHGQDNYVYVRARNIGTLAAENTTIEVYRSGSSMGQSWPFNWGLVGKATIDSLEPNASKIVKIKWPETDIPAPGHYCFYARALNEQDPMFALETRNMVQNTRTNNNIAWRNFNVIGLLDKVKEVFEVGVANPIDEDTVVELRFEEPDNMLEADGAKAIVDLGEVLFQRWQDAGGQGENVKVLSDTEVELLKTPATFIGIPLNVGESFPITMRVEATQPMPVPGESRVYIFSAQQFINGELVGGVDYAITTRALDTDSDGDGIKDINDEDSDNDTLSDDWEIENGLNPLDPTDANEDKDGDGYTNKEEFEQGTNPNDDTSTPPQGTAKGTIFDKSGQPIAGVEVTVGGITVTTNEQGQWEVTGLPEDQSYDIVAEKAGIQFPTKTCEVGQDQDCEVNIKAGSLLSLGVKVNPSRPNQGDNVTYTLTINNQGEATATGIVLDMPLPANASLVEVNAQAPMVCDNTTCTLAELAAGAQASVSIVIASEDATRLTNTISLTSNEYPGESIAKRVAVIPHLSVEKVSKTQTITQGDSFSLIYTVAVNGNAPDAAENIQFKTELPRGYTLLDTSETCTIDDLTLTCDMGNMAVGDSREVQLDLRLDDFYALWASHRAVVKADNYPSDGAAIMTKVYLGDAVVDIIIAIDVTGSMHDEITALEAVITKLEATLDTMPEAQPMMAVISFRDDIYLEAATTHLEEVKAAVEKMEAKGGGACPEASYEAMTLAVKHAKTGGTIILVTDAPPYPDVDMNELINAINAKNLELAVIQPTTICSSVDDWQFQ